MRLRTLPVSVAGVITAIGYAAHNNVLRWMPAMLCLLFAVSAQIASNFANEYYDYRDGLDKPGREGPRRGVTEGDISPRAMLSATYITLCAACATGLSLLLYGPWWLMIVGAVTGAGVFAYSAGPYPLSRHGLGEVAVILFFGIIPVNFTYYLQSGAFDMSVLAGSVSIGLMGANVLLVNNYRDAEADAAVGKHTLAVICGRRFASALYLFNGLAAAAVMWSAWRTVSAAAVVVPSAYAVLHIFLWWRIIHMHGSALNPMLGATAMLMLAYGSAFALA